MRKFPHPLSPSPCIKAWRRGGLLVILMAAFPGADPLPILPPSPAPDSAKVQVVSGDTTKGTIKSTTKDAIVQVRSRADTVLIVKHGFNHREQIIAGGVIMACLAGMLVVMNNYNPR